MLSWIDVLQTNKTGISVGATRSGQIYGTKNVFVFRGQKLPINYKHVNFDKVDNSNFIYEQIRMRYNHYPLSDEAYNAIRYRNKPVPKVFLRIKNY